VRLVHVVDARLPLASAPMTGVVEELRRHGRTLLHEARITVRAPLDEVVEELREGSSREDLVAACAEHRPAIAVVGSRGIGGFRGLLLGSTARELVSHAGCPVLVTRGSSTNATASGRSE
jgi:nucleotide-binding universal stress UspA family protein